MGRGGSRVDPLARDVRVRPIIRELTVGGLPGYDRSVVTTVFRRPATGTGPVPDRTRVGAPESTGN